ncbi:hypothetical protein pb186bvf_016646 [Paramecium bursaria]
MIQNQQFKFVKHMIFQSQDIILTAQISEKGKFLAIGGIAGKIQIFYLNQRSQLRIFSWIVSKDSNILFSGDAKGYLHGYIKWHQRGIQDMMIIDDNEILICSNYSIQITNVKLKQQLLNFLPYLYHVLKQFEYDKSREWIIIQTIIQQISSIEKMKSLNLILKSTYFHRINIIIFKGLNLLSACRYDFISGKLIIIIQP